MYKCYNALQLLIANCTILERTQSIFVFSHDTLNIIEGIVSLLGFQFLSFFQYKACLCVPTNG